MKRESRLALVRREHKTRRRWLVVIFLLCMTFFVAGCFIAFWQMGLFADPDFSKINDVRETSIIYSDSGEVLREYCTFCREITTLGDMGVFPNLVVVAEDKNFWSHSGFDKLGMVRATWQFFRTGRVHGASTITQQVARVIFAEEELRQEREAKPGWEKRKAQLWRKAREAYIAQKLERTTDKRKILELYLNNAWCGTRHGVKACSRYWFHKDPLELDIHEAAMIVGLLRSPGKTPRLNPSEALALRGRVLQQLAGQGVISEEERRKFQAIPLPERSSPLNCPSAHAVEFIRKKILETGHLVDKGLRVYSTINCEGQRAASKALGESIRAMQERNNELTDLRGVAIVLSRRNGAIPVFAQWPPFEENQYLIDQVRRQAGSAFKPFLYAQWLRAGGRLDCNDPGNGPCRLDDSFESHAGKSGLSLSMGNGLAPKHIQNFPYEGLPRYTGMIPAILALAESRNVATMSVISGIKGSRAPQLVTKEDLLELTAILKMELATIKKSVAIEKKILTVKPALAKLLMPNLSSDRAILDPGHTMAIGSIDVSPFDMARAFTGLLGGLVEPYMVEELRDHRGRLIGGSATREKEVVKVLGMFVEHETDLKSPDKESLDKLNNLLGLEMTRALRAPVEYPHGTARAVKRELAFQVCGKTGTATNDAGETTDNWFVGCTPSYVMVIWIGRERKLPIKTTEVLNEQGRPKKIQETGGLNALPVFVKTMREMYRFRALEKFPENTNPLRPFRETVEPREVVEKEKSEEENSLQGDDF